MAKEIDPEDLAALQKIFDLRERAIEALLAGEPAQALARAEQAVQESRRLREPEQVPPLLKDKFASLLYRIGRELAQKRLLDEAVRALRLVADIEGQVGNSAGQASLLSDLATMQLEAGHPEEAIRIYESEVLPLRLRLGVGPDIRRTQRNVGLAYLRLHDASTCCSHLLRSLQPGEGQLSPEEATTGLQTVLAAAEKGLVIPPSFQAQFRAIARDAGLKDLERRFAAPGRETQTSFRRIKVFISYSHSDREQVGPIRQFLPSQLFDVFFDRDRLYPGWTWEPALLQMIRDADVFVLLIGAGTLERDYVNKEVDTFLAANKESGRKGLIPVLIEGCEQIPAKVAAYQALDLRGSDAQSRARSIGRAIHDAYVVPATEIANGERRRPEERDDKAGERLREKWQSGQIGLSPQAASQMVNLGISTSGFRCACKEQDMATLEPRQCQAQASLVCVACVMGACGEPFHTYDRFCTVLPPGELFSPGTKLFYWCISCHGPVCTRCLQIEDDYPCPPEQVLSYRFQCPACRAHIQVVPVLNVDMEGVARELLRWARAGGPPDLART